MAELFAAKGQSNTTSDLYSVDETTGAVTSVGAIGFALTGMAQDPTTGTLYGVTSGNSASHPRALITINPSTGAGTLVADLSGDDVTINDIAFRSDGQLFGVGQGVDGGCTIDKATGVVTALPNSIDPTTFGNGNSFDSGDVWYCMPRGGRPNSPSTNRGHLFTINDTTGVGTDLGATTGGPGNNAQVSALAFDPGDVLYGAYIDSTVTNLVTIDTGTRAVTTIGDMGSGFDALAWVESSGPATQVKFGVQPSDTCADATITPAVTVRIEDAGGVLVTTSTAAVTVAIGTNPGGGTLTGTLTVNAVGGIATFSDLSIDAAGVSYDLDASSSGLTSDTSAPFDIFEPAANDTCATATDIGGAAGTVTQSTCCSLEPGSDPDALEDWFSIAVEHRVFFKYTAPADGYIQFTISKPGGSPLNHMVAGVLSGPCGSEAVDPDTILNQEAVNNVTSFPAVIGHLINAGDSLWVEIADSVDDAGVCGTFDLAWSLRTVTYFDCPDTTVQFGPDLVPTTDLGSGVNVAYCRDTIGDHWIAYWKATGVSGFDELHVAHLDAGGGSWTDWLVYSTVGGVVLDGLVPQPGISIATDGTHVWVANQFREADIFLDPDQTQSVYVWEYGGGSWPHVATITGSKGNLDLPGQIMVGPRMAASAAEPGVCYVVTTDTGSSAARTEITKVDDTSMLWTSIIIGTQSTFPHVVNGGGAPYVFVVPVADDTVTMYGIDPTTGAATALQSFDYPELGLNSSAGSPVVQYMSGSREPAMSGTSGTVYYLAVQWSSPIISNAFEVLEVSEDGSTDFTYFDGDPAKALVGAATGDGGHIVFEPDNVWLGRVNALDQFDRICFDGWNVWSPQTGVDDLANSTYLDLEGDILYDLGRFSNQIGVAVTPILRLGCVCELGPEVVLGTAGIYMVPRIIG